MLLHRRAHLISFPQITVSMENILPIGCLHEDMRAIVIAVYFLWHNLVHATLAPWYCRVARRRCRVRHSIHTCHLSLCGCASGGLRNVAFTDGLIKIVNSSRQASGTQLAHIASSSI